MGRRSTRTTTTTTTTYAIVALVSVLVIGLTVWLVLGRRKTPLERESDSKPVLIRAVLDANPTNNSSSSMAIVLGTAAALALLAVGGLAIFRKHTSQADERAIEVKAEEDKEDAGAAAADVAVAAAPSPALKVDDAAAFAAPGADDVAVAAVHDAPSPAPSPAAHVDGEEKEEGEDVHVHVAAAVALPKVQQKDRSEGAQESYRYIPHHQQSSSGMSGGVGARREVADASAGGGWLKGVKSAAASFFTPARPNVVVADAAALRVPVPAVPVVQVAQVARRPANSNRDDVVDAIISKAAEGPTRTYLQGLNAEVKKALGVSNVDDLVVKQDEEVKLNIPVFAANELHKVNILLAQKKEVADATAAANIAGVVDPAFVDPFEEVKRLRAIWGNGPNAAHPKLQIRIVNKAQEEELYSVARGDGDCGFWAVLSAMKLLKREERITDIAKILLGEDAQPPKTLDKLKEMVKAMAVIMKSILENRGNKMENEYFGGVQVTLGSIEEYQGQMNEDYDIISGGGLFQILAVLYGIGITVWEGGFIESVVQVEWGGAPFPMVYVSTGEGHYNVHAATSSPSEIQLLRIKHGGWVEEAYLNGKLKHKEHPAKDAIQNKRYDIVRAVVVV